MKRIVMSLLSVLLLASFCYADRCEVDQEAGYLVGYEGGVGDRELGYECNPAEAYYLPEVQVVIEILYRRAIREKYGLSAEEEFNRCFREGFFEGYRDGYYGREKKKMKYNWGGYEYGGSIFEKKEEYEDSRK